MSSGFFGIFGPTDMMSAKAGFFFFFSDFTTGTMFDLGMPPALTLLCVPAKKPEDTADPDKEVKKSDAYVQVSASCDCCSPSTQAFGTLVEDYFEKGKKKSKPFHGYNPKRHHRKGGLNAAGRAKFKRETGANLKPPVTTKPSKLKPGSKRAKRRKSFCARMSGSKGPTSKDGKLTPKGAALKRWNC